MYICRTAWSGCSASYPMYIYVYMQDGMEWLQRAPERIKRARMGRFRLSFQDEERPPIDYG